MRVWGVVVALLVSATWAVGQTTPEWVRVYTFDDSIVEMNTRDVSLMGNGRGRITFRQTFSTPQLVAGTPGAQYTASLEILEFDCTGKQYRPFGFIKRNAAGDIVQFIEGGGKSEWRASAPDRMIGRYALSACQLIGARENPPPPPPPQIADPQKLRRAGLTSVKLWQELERTGDFAPLVQKYFAADFFRHLRVEGGDDRFAKLDPDTAAKLSPAELRRYYLALLNAEYLGSRYVLALDGANPDSRPRDVFAAPAIIRAVERHPYSLKYRGAPGDYAHLAQPIDDVERVRLYSDLLETVNTLLRQELRMHQRGAVSPIRTASVDWTGLGLDGESGAKICNVECFGLAPGTSIYSIELPLFRLELAEIRGQMRVVSVTYNRNEY